MAYCGQVSCTHYSGKKHQRELFQHAANMYLALGMKSVADACSAVGLDRDGSDWEGVKYHIKAFKKKGLDKALKEPEGRRHTLQKQEDLVPGSPEKYMPKPRPSEDETHKGASDKGYSYDMAVMEVGELTSRSVDPMSQHGAIKHVFEKTNIKVSRSPAEWSHRNKGLVPPSNRGLKWSRMRRLHF